MRNLLVALTIAFTVVACSKKEAPATSTSGSSSDCSGKTCGDCLHVAGCWWNSTSKSCRDGLPDGVDPAAANAKGFTNEPGDCK